MHHETGKLFDSVGKLHYEGHNKLILIVDPEIVRYYRSLIPKWCVAYPQLYPPHISVVRKEHPPNTPVWGRHEGELIKFKYSNNIYQGTVYWWLNAFSLRLEEIRMELGLSVSSEYTRPPEGFIKCFHISLANKKER